MIGPESRLQRDDRVLSQVAADTLVLFHLDEGQYYAVDETGARVWDLCDGSRNVAELIAVICQEYEAPAETIQADVWELLTELVHEKLVVETQPTAGLTPPPA
jgi:Coenzyme PQQ synthesis protein D (PqqD)